MKIEWNKKYTTIGVYALFVICGSIVFYNIISRFNVYRGEFNKLINMLSPFILGFVIAYLLNFVLKFYEEKVFKFNIFKNLSHKGKRSLGVLFTYISVMIILGLFLRFVLPELIDSIQRLGANAYDYAEKLIDISNYLIENIDIGEEYIEQAVDKWKDFINYLPTVAKNLVPSLTKMVGNIFSSILNITLGVTISIYLLLDKERFLALNKKITYALFPKKKCEKVIDLIHKLNETFGKFLVGKILDSTIVGFLTFIVLSIFNMPYVLVVSVIVGVTNIIPYFGPLIGVIPCVLIIFIVSPIKALGFLLISNVIQQIDGNIIGPKILGDSLGISGFWILFSILIFGKLFGFVGMVIGAPLFAVIYILVKEIVENRLKHKGLPEKTEEYM